MQIIKTFPAPITDSFTLDLPCLMSVLTVRNDPGGPFLSVLYEDTSTKRTRWFRWLTKDDPIDGWAGVFVGAVDYGGRVYFLFDQGEAS